MIQKSFRGILLFLLIFTALSGAASCFVVLYELPGLDRLPDQLAVPNVKIVDRNGRLLYEVIDENGGRHAVVPMERIPLVCKQAAIATEDRSFYSNSGVDLRGMARAVWINLSGGETIAGGSTITQQVARNLLLDAGERSQRSLHRKLRESLLAWQLTRQYSKDQILGLYLNQIYFGGMAYGIESASETFFGKPVDRLDLAECAMLAGLPQSPAAYNPFTDSEAAENRQSTVLGLMEKAGFITHEQVMLAQREQLVYAEIPYPIEAPHFVMMVRRQLDTIFTSDQIHDLGGLVVRTTLDLDWQTTAEKAVYRQLTALSRSYLDIGHNVNNAALVALDPDSGDVLALVGSPDYFDPYHGGAVNMAISPRQPGSALKPLVYAAALNPGLSGGAWSAATMLLDVRTSFTTQDGKAYSPENYDLHEHGPILLREALASSLNIPAVIALNHVGLDRLFSFAENLGINSLGNPKDYDLSLALGGGTVRLIDLAAAYGAFANGGFRLEPRLILDAAAPDGRSVYSASPPARIRVLDERVAWLVSDILSDPEARRLGFGANSILRMDRPAAVKTGTTSNFHDNWTIGYTPNLVVGVWSGNTDYQPMREVNGLTGAAPIWHEFMRTVLAGSPHLPFTRPAGLEQAEICSLSGGIPTEACPYRKLEWFIPGTEPVEQDSIYRQVYLDSATGLLADPSTPAERRISKIVLDLPQPAQSWGKSQDLPLIQNFEYQTDRPAPVDQHKMINASRDQDFSIVQLVSPSSGSIFRLAEGFVMESQRIRLEAAGAPGVRSLQIFVDGNLVGSSDAVSCETWWILEPGVHKAWAEAVTSDGQAFRSAMVEFEVLK